jgi:hypothetical protein
MATGSVPTLPSWISVNKGYLIILRAQELAVNKRDIMVAASQAELAGQGRWD